MVVEQSISGHGFEVGDMVWAKMKSQPWWPGHVYSEDFATPLVRRSKREGEGMLLVAFFGSSSFGWFDCSELVSFDCNYAEMCRQTSSRAFVRAVEEAVVEVNRRIGLGMSCVCRNKQSFRAIDVQGFVVVDVAGYDSGAVYSVDAIRKARDGFQPKLAYDFLRQLALEPTDSEHADDINFVKNKATVVAYRKAVFKDFDEHYDQASIQEPGRQETSSKAPLNGMAVLADSLGKHKKDEYLFKPRDDSKEIIKEKEEVISGPGPGPEEVKIPKRPVGEPTLENIKKQKKEGISEGKNFSLPLADGEPNATKSSEDNVEPSSGLKRGPSDCQEDVNDSKKKKVGDIRTLTDEKKLTTRDVKQPVAMTLKKPGPEPTMLVLKFPQGGSLPSFNELKARFARYGPMDHSATQILRNSLSCQVAFRHKAHAKAAYGFVVESTSLFGNTDVKCSLKGVGDVDAAEPELLVGVPKNHHQPAPSLVPATSGGEEAAGKGGREVFADSLGKVMNTARPTNYAKKDDCLFKPEAPQRSDGNYETDLLRVLDDLHSLAVDPFNTVNTGSRIKVRKAFLRFRSLVFQKGQNFSLPLAGGEPNASKSSEDSVQVPPVKPPSGLKRGAPNHQQEMTAAKKKKVGDIKSLTKEKKVTKMIDGPLSRVVNQPVSTTLKKPVPELIKKTEPQLAPGPTMLTLKFPQGGSLPSYNELKSRFARFGPMDHSGTHIFWNTFSCQVVFRHKAHAHAAYRFVVESTSLFGNTGVKCTLKEVPTVSSARPEPPVVVSSGVQPKSILKKSGGEEAAANGGKGRVKFMLGGEESQIEVALLRAAYGSSPLTKNVSSNKNEKAVHPVVTSPTGSSTPPPPPMRYGTTLLSPPSLPPCSMQRTPLQVLNRPPSDRFTTPNIDIKEQMLSLLMRCNDIVTNVSSILGYSPYHPL
ncbi:putative non-specific serine/threonine protein kinase [Helianthus annuus]|nr:putative non-specific serine/threonine protein kinase [Helianthus annuus]